VLRAVISLAAVLHLACQGAEVVDVTPFHLAQERLPRPAGVTSIEVLGCAFTTDPADSGSLRLDPAAPAACRGKLARSSSANVKGTAPGGRKLRFQRPISQPGRPAELELRQAQAVFSSRADRVTAVACFLEDRWQRLNGRHADLKLLVDDRAVIAQIERGSDCVAELGNGRLVNVASVPSWHVVATAFPITAGVVLPTFTLAISAVLLFRFRRRVLRTMREQPPAELPATDVPPTRVAPRLAHRVLQTPPSSWLRTQALRRLRRQMAGYLLVTLCCTVILGIQRAAVAEVDHTWSRALVLTLLSALPIVPTLAVFFQRRGLASRLLAIYLVLVIALGWLVADLSALETLTLVVVATGSSWSLLLLLSRRVRSAAPWVYLVIAGAFVAAHIPAALLFVRPGLATRMLSLADRLGLSALALFLLWEAAAVLVAMVLSWRIARLVAVGYDHFRMNDRLFILGSLWLVHALFSGLTLASPDVSRLLGSMTSVLPVAIALLAAGVLARHRHSAERVPRVLYLRSFDAGARNVDLVAALQVPLLNVMTLDLIAGPDLATSLARPRELLDFVAGKGARRYLNDLKAFEARRQARRSSRDAEGRHSVQEYYCHNAIWIEAFQRLAAEADLVLFDGRALRQRQSGAGHELTQVLHRVPLAKVLVLVGDEENTNLVRVHASASWKKLPVHSPNRQELEPVLDLFTYNDRAPAEVGRLFAHLCAKTKLAFTPSGKDLSAGGT
jgi:hypothetical protein